MTDLLKGNFKTTKESPKHDDAEENIEHKFEREATKKIGGSIAFVSKKKVMWDDNA